MQKMKAGAIQNDKGRETEKPRESIHPIYGVRTYHQRWYVRSPKALAEGSCLSRTDKRGNKISPSFRYATLPLNIIAIAGY
jgi:hypothetical protein